MVEFTREQFFAERPPLRETNVRSITFIYRIYLDWAANQVFDYIEAHPEWSTEYAIEKFIDMMDRFSENARSKESAYVFCVARDEAEYLYDCYIGELIRDGAFDKEVLCRQFHSTPVTMRCE